MESLKEHYTEKLKNMAFIPTNYPIKNSIKRPGSLSLSRVLLAVSLIFITSVVLHSCGVYSFTGASIPPQAKTISILNFPNKAELVQPSLSQVLTEKMRDRFTSQTSLNLVPRNGDLHLEGEIVGYSTEPVAIVAGQTAGFIRLKINVNVRFVNKYDSKSNFESSFSRYKDYSSTQDLRQVEDGLIDEISDELVDDIFNKSVVNW